MNHSPIPDFTETEQPPSALNLQLDWDAYFDEFKRVHGEPVIYGGKILFPDSWTYNLRDKSGPEWPPPKDELQLLRLQRDYWQLRYQTVKAEFDQAADLVRNLRALQRSKSLPLQQAMLTTDEQGRPKRKSELVDIDALEFGRMKWLADDILQCRQKIEEYQSQLVHLDRIRNLSPVRSNT